MSRVLVAFSEGGRVVVPLYQRNYDWDRQNCKQLLDDVRGISTPDRKAERHFLSLIHI